MTSDTTTKACETPGAKQRRVWDKTAPSYGKQIGSRPAASSASSPANPPPIEVPA